MKINDALVGAALMLVGAVVLWHVQSFPSIPGQRYGAGVFPGVVAAGLVACGGLLVVKGLRAAAPWMVVDARLRRPRVLLAFLSVAAGLGIYVLAADRLGFHVTGALLLLVWSLAFGARPAVAAAVAAIAPVVIHLAFYKLLRIPLPWGLLEPLAF